jgi:hypothetical protein
MKKILLSLAVIILCVGTIFSANLVKADNLSGISNINVSVRVEGTVVAWTTATPTDSTVDYTDIVTLAKASKTDENLTIYHSVLLSGLANSRTYQYSVSGKDINGYLRSSDELRFTTLANSSTADDIPYMSYVKATPGTNNILVTWTTSIPATSIVRYVDLYQDTPSSQTDYSLVDNSFVTNHSILISALPSLRSYKIYVSSKDANSYLMSTSFDGTIVKTLSSLNNNTPADLAVTAITFSGSKEGVNGTLSVTVKNLGGDLTSGQGLMNWYNNFSTQNFIFSSETPSILSYRGSRPDPTASNPLRNNESITFSWVGKFNTAGNLNLQFTVDNANELVESNENNNTLSVNIPISNSAVVGNDRDEHGCIASAGYTWCGMKQECLRSWEEKCESIDIVTISPVTTFISQANLLNDTSISQLLAQINSLKNTIAEQANQIKYLNTLVKGTNISTDAQNTLNNFITYGSDANTKKLGAGERAAVIASYKSAFDKLPTTSAELTDVVKIANGRWPSATSTDAEAQAKIQFKKVYQREANMSNANDNAAVTVMAYGLRQKAENRNLASEAKGIKTFKAIYGHTPRTTEEWNIMQAITYSGASR